MEELYLLEFAAKLLYLVVLLFLISSLDALLIPIGPLFQLQYNSLAWIKANWRAAEKCYKFGAALVYVFDCSHKSIGE